jgi:hypothetical protein
VHLSRAYLLTGNIQSAGFLTVRDRKNFDT